MANRTYIVFTKDDGDGSTWTEYAEIVASGADAAITKAHNEGAKANKFAATPKRNWAVREPEIVVRQPLLKLKPVHPDQMSVDEVLAGADEALAAAGKPAA